MGKYRGPYGHRHPTRGSEALCRASGGGRDGDWSGAPSDVSLALPAGALKTQYLAPLRAISSISCLNFAGKPLPRRSPRFFFDSKPLWKRQPSEMAFFCGSNGCRRDQPVDISEVISLIKFSALLRAARFGHELHDSPMPKHFQCLGSVHGRPMKTQPPRGGSLSTSYRHLCLAHARHPLFQLFFESGPGKWFHLTPQPGFLPGPAAALTPSMRGGEPTNINARAFIALRFSSAHIPSLCRLYDQVC